MHIYIICQADGKLTPYSIRSLIAVTEGRLIDLIHSYIRTD